MKTFLVTPLFPVGPSALVRAETADIALKRVEELFGFTDCVAAEVELDEQPLYKAAPVMLNALKAVKRMGAALGNTDQETGKTFDEIVSDAIGKAGE